MKKLDGHQEFRSGGTYCSTYVGENKAYARINGKRTILVKRTEPDLVFVELFDQFGDPFTEDIRGGEITSMAADLLFGDREVFEPESENEWFKHSMKFDSLSTPLAQGLITKKDIEEKASWGTRCPFTAVFGLDHKFKGVSARFDVEDKTPLVLLQAVFIVWPTWEALREDFEGLDIIVRT